MLRHDVTYHFVLGVQHSREDACRRRWRAIASETVPYPLSPVRSRSPLEPRFYVPRSSRARCISRPVILCEGTAEDICRIKEPSHREIYGREGDEERRFHCTPPCQRILASICSGINGSRVNQPEFMESSDEEGLLVDTKLATIFNSLGCVSNINAVIRC